MPSFESLSFGLVMWALIGVTCPGCGGSWLSRSDLVTTHHMRPSHTFSHQVSGCHPARSSVQSMFSVAEVAPSYLPIIPLDFCTHLSAQNQFLPNLVVDNGRPCAQHIWRALRLRRVWSTGSHGYFARIVQPRNIPTNRPASDPQLSVASGQAEHKSTDVITHKRSE